MNRLRIFIVLVWLISCGPQHESPRYVRMASHIERQVSQELREHYNLFQIGTGGGMMDAINYMAMMFNFYDEVDMNTARELSIAAGTKLLNALNDNEEIRPYLRYYPFRIEDIGIKIFFKKADHYDVDVGRISACSLHRGIIDFFEKVEERFKINCIKEEPFAEAYQIVKGVPYNPPPSKLQPVIKDDPI